MSLSLRYFVSLSLRYFVSVTEVFCLCLLHQPVLKKRETETQPPTTARKEDPNTSKGSKVRYLLVRTKGSKAVQKSAFY